MPAVKKEKGFTLIELLVVIAIIAVLSSVGIVVYSTTQKAGRVSKRIQDLKAMQTALELFKSTNGKYPTVPTAGTFVCVKDLGNTAGQSLVPSYMPQVPNDPSDPSGATLCYQYTSDPTAGEYKIRTNITTSAGLPEMTDADYLQQAALIDPAEDYDISSGHLCTVDTTLGGGPQHIKSWALYSGGTACSY